MKKLRSSTKAGAAAILIAVGAYYARGWAQDAYLRDVRFTPPPPGRVNLVGINPGAGYRIIIANDVAQLVQTQGGFGGKEEASQGATEGSIKKRVPMRELLGVLRGDGKMLGPFVMRMNDKGEKDDWSPVRVVWTKADLERAMGGDARLKAKLEHDLNVRLDGTPVTPLNRNSLENGIFLQEPVEMTVNVNGKPTVVRGETLEPYKPQLIRATEAHYADKANVDNAMIAGYYADEARSAMAKPAGRENVAASLKGMISKEKMETLLEIPRQLLSNATVVLNEASITDASYKSYRSNEGKTLCDLTVDLNDEGRKRLWKFSKDRVGSQILLIADDVAIAAPRIEHELALSEFTVRQLPDEVLVNGAVKSIQGSKGRMAKE